MASGAGRGVQISYQLFLWVFLWLVAQGVGSRKVTSYSYWYSYGLWYSYG